MENDFRKSLKVYILVNSMDMTKSLSFNVLVTFLNFLLITRLYLDRSYYLKLISVLNTLHVEQVLFFANKL